MENIEINSTNKNLELSGNNNISIEANLPVLDMSANKNIQISSSLKQLNIKANGIITTGEGKVKDVLVNGESVLDEQGNANIEIPEVDNDYNNATNKPSINGVTLEGNKTTEDLGIEASGGVKGVEVNNNDVVNADGIAEISVPRKMSQLENDTGFVNRLSTSLEYYYTKNETDKKIDALPLGTIINIIDTFNYLKIFNNNDIYNANAVNSSIDWTIQAILEAFNREVIISINAVVNPQTFQIMSIDGSYSEVVNAVDLGGIPRIVCQLAGTNIKVYLNLAMVDGYTAYFTTTMKVDLGAGEMKYLLGINVSERYTKVIIEPLV